MLKRFWCRFRQENRRRSASMNFVWFRAVSMTKVLYARKGKTKTRYMDGWWTVEQLRAGGQHGE